MSTSTEPRLRIAISGGGLAGAITCHALSLHPHLDVHIFESAPAFKEAGAAIGVARNAQKALNLIGPSAVECLKSAGAVPLAGVRFKLGYGPDQGTLIDEALSRSDNIVSIVHRATFLRELLLGVPEDRMHASKKLVEVNEGQHLTLHFQDGSTHDCDILIGADGIHSRVRKFVLGEDDPAASPVCAGFWLVQALHPYEETRAVLGKDLIDFHDPREYGWIGDGTFMMHNVLSDGTLAQLMIGVACNPDEADGQWQKVVTKEELAKACEGGPKHLGDGFRKLAFNGEETIGIYTYEHLPAKTYTRGRMCVLGDAAHATSPWQASGAGMSIEDAMILSTLLGRIRSVKDAGSALKVYDHVRRPRTQKIVQSSKVTGQIMCGRGEGIELDLEKLKASLVKRWDFIVYIDMAEHQAEAIHLLKKQIS